MNQSKRNFFKFRKSPIKKANLNKKNIDIEIENERNKDTILKLKEQIVAKDKEISDLKVSKIRNDEQFQKTMKIFDEIVRKSDKSTVQGMKELEKNLHNKRNFSKNNINDINKYNTSENDKRTNHMSENSNNNIYKNNNINQNYIESDNSENNNLNNDNIKPKIHLKKSQRKKLNDLLNIHSLKLKLNQQNKILLKRINIFKNAK